MPLFRSLTALVMSLGAVLSCVIWLPLVGFAQESSSPEPEKIIAQVQKQYDRPGGFKTWFRQETLQKGVAQGDQAEGWMFFQKPCRMRWQYEKPLDQKKEVIADGHQVWIYLPEDALAMVYPLNQVLRSDLVMRFFSGIGQVSQDFRLSWQRPPAGGGPYIINLVPRQPQAELKTLTLTINPQTYLVEKLEFINALGEETRFAFSRTSLDVNLASNFFTFTPPPGVQIVREAPGSR